MKKLVAVLLLVLSASVLYAGDAVLPAQVENLVPSDEAIDYFFDDITLPAFF